MLNGSVVDVSKIRTAHQRFLTANDRLIADALNPEAIVAGVQRHMSAGILLGMRSGHLSKSTSARYRRTSNGSIVSVMNTARYAWAQDQGSGLYGPKHAKYPITPRGNYPLKFYWARKKKHVEFWRVMHPGVKPSRFLQVASNLTFETRIALLRAGMRTAARHF